MDLVAEDYAGAFQITPKQFKKAAGRDPVDDDLHRANCVTPGDAFHATCGWCSDCKKPRFVCGHLASPGSLR